VSGPTAWRGRTLESGSGRLQFRVTTHPLRKHLPRSGRLRPFGGRSARAARAHSDQIEEPPGLRTCAADQEASRGSKSSWASYLCQAGVRSTWRCVLGSLVFRAAPRPVVPEPSTPVTEWRAMVCAMPGPARPETLDPVTKCFLVAFDLDAEAIISFDDAPLPDHFLHPVSPPFAAAPANLGVCLHVCYNTHEGRR
jgi:hypothetical protein